MLLYWLASPDQGDDRPWGKLDKFQSLAVLNTLKVPSVLLDAFHPFPGDLVMSRSSNNFQTFISVTSIDVIQSCMMWSCISGIGPTGPTVPTPKKKVESTFAFLSLVAFLVSPILVSYSVTFLLNFDLSDITPNFLLILLDCHCNTFLNLFLGFCC